jgi:hypothetical protein
MKIERLYNLGKLGVWHTIFAYAFAVCTLFVWTWSFCDQMDVLSVANRSYVHLVIASCWLFLGIIGLIAVFATAISKANDGFRNPNAYANMEGGNIGNPTASHLIRALKYGRSGISDKVFFTVAVFAGIVYLIAAAVQFGIAAPIGSAGVDRHIPSLGNATGNVTWNEMRNYIALKTVADYGASCSAAVIYTFFVVGIIQLAYIVGRLFIINFSNLGAIDTKATGSITNAQPFSTYAQPGSGAYTLSSPLQLLGAGKQGA